MWLHEKFILYSFVLCSITHNPQTESHYCCQHHFIYFIYKYGYCSVIFAMFLICSNRIHARPKIRCK